MSDAGWASDLEEFLAGHGLPVRDLTRSPDEAEEHVCGAAVLLSAAAGAVLAGAPARPSPTHAVPDVVAVVYGPGAGGGGPPPPPPTRAPPPPQGSAHDPR
jgi:para-aminobenzoate synthetase component 1